MFAARTEPRASGSLRLLGACVLVLAGAVELVAAPIEDDEFPSESLRPGLVATLTDADGRFCQRVDSTLALAWQNEPPDPRLAASSFHGNWQGRLFSIVPGTYRLHGFVQGQVSVRVAGQTVIEGNSAEPAWLDGEGIELEYGYHPLQISYDGNASSGHLALYWSGPQFQLEPVPAWHLFHTDEATPGEGFHAGERLVRALRCNACHALPSQAAPLPGPDLTRLRGNMAEAWLVDWLATAHHGSSEATDEESTVDDADAVLRRMPTFDLNRDEATAIATWLMASTDDDAPSAVESTEIAGDVEAGETLFHTVGCLACHRLNDLGRGGLFGGGDLTNVASKRPAEFFDRWLADPAQLNAAHRMPVFDLADQERHDLAAYLATLGEAPSESASNQLDATEQRVAQGKQLVETYRCGACHELPSGTAETSPVDLAWSAADWQHACTQTADRARAQPGYRLRPGQSAAIREFVTRIVRMPADRAPPLSGGLVMAERNCLNCHSREQESGLAPVATQLAERNDHYALRLPALTPPSLNGVGDKLTDAALADAIATRRAPLRPWLDVRMPRFDLSDAESRAIVEHLIEQDRIPDLPSTETDDDPLRLRVAGERLVTSAGFGCTSCHQIGSFEPQDVALAARGTNLSLLGERMRRPWYERWVRNPARIVPRMEMPSVQQPIHGVLDDDLADQLAAVWHVLNVPDFEPPAAGAIRVVRSRNVPDAPEQASVLTDVLEIGKRRYIKPLLVGLDNRHNVLFDLASAELAGWWFGDTARQRTRGKTWYWEPGGSHLIEPEQPAGQWQLELNGAVLTPARRGQFVSELEWLEHQPDGIRCGFRLHFDPPSGEAASVEVDVTLSIAAVRSGSTEDDQTGFVCRYEVAGLPSQAQLRYGLWPMVDSIETENERTLSFATDYGPCHVQLDEPEGATWQVADDQHWLALDGGEPGTPLAFAIRYATRAPVDRFPLLPPEIDPPERLVLDEVVPGFEAVRLPLRDEPMPTGLAWRPDGTLIVSSLKGRVWLAHDTDDDGLEDDLQPFSDELAAPYGVASRGQAIDVINKYALLRLFDDDGDGRADRMRRLASGWGHTHDYHDWAVGLVDDGEGGYYVALPCQQDDRTVEEAHLRGHVIRLRAEGEEHFEVEDYCAGLRFPMGLARSAEGELFSTDNQGNYTPFNELNHLLPGRRYGFINKLERSTGFDPPHESPAIQIPHPWTRSVNGICFLTSPAGQNHFGAFEGHLVGCEYDTRRLIRLSLQRVGESFQGAAYPLSLPVEAGAESLMGPLVCAISPQGDLYVGNIRDSAWGGGANHGALVRLRAQGELPPGIAEVRAAHDGFEIDFTQPVDRDAASLPSAYAVASYRRQRTPAYGGDDQDRADHAVREVQLSADGRRASLRVDNLRAGFVYELRVRNLHPEGKRFFPAEAHYTMHEIP